MRRGRWVKVPAKPHPQAPWRTWRYRLRVVGGQPGEWVLDEDSVPRRLRTSKVGDAGAEYWTTGDPYDIDPTAPPPRRRDARDHRVTVWAGDCCGRPCPLNGDRCVRRRPCVDCRPAL